MPNQVPQPYGSSSPAKKLLPQLTAVKKQGVAQSKSANNLVLASQQQLQARVSDAGSS